MYKLRARALTTKYGSFYELRKSTCLGLIKFSQSIVHHHVHIVNSFKSKQIKTSIILASVNLFCKKKSSKDERLK